MSLKLRARLSEREKALRALHQLAGKDRGRLRALLRNHRGRWPRTPRRG